MSGKQLFEGSPNFSGFLHSILSNLNFFHRHFVFPSDGSPLRSIMTNDTDDNGHPREHQFPQRRETLLPTEGRELNPVIENFLKTYSVEHYALLAEHAKDLINAKLKAERKEKPDSERLQARVWSRGKEKQSLRDKLAMRDGKWQYENAEQIKKDIVDLAGVRIVLYMPSNAQRDKAEQMVREIWQDVSSREHTGSRSDGQGDPETYKPTHLGYKADHYRAHMTEEQSSRKEPGYTFEPGDQVEIQVVSALTHAWAEAGHDVLYKEWKFGPPTREEERVLDAINGIVLSGDILLQQFHEYVRKRTYAKFLNKDELRVFFRDLNLLKDSRESRNFANGPLDVLLKFLQLQGKDYPIPVRNALGDLGFPKAPKLDQVMRNFSPPFESDDNMIATICLIHQMRPEWMAHREGQYPPTKRLRIMMNALKLLQDFAGEPERAKTFLMEDIDANEAEKKSLEFVLIDSRRQVALAKEEELGTEGASEEHQQKIEPKLLHAWDWFQHQVDDERSICGLVFRLADMGAIDLGWQASLDQLSIGPLSRSSTSSNPDVWSAPTWNTERV